MEIRIVNKDFSKNLIFAVIVIAVGLLLLEGGARLLESRLPTPDASEIQRPGWQTEFFGSLFDWHEPDPDLLWRFKAGLDNPLITTNSDHFLGPEIPRTKPPDSYRVMILGDSSPVGLGLQSRRQTFGEMLRYLLESYFGPRKKVEVINAAVSGYSSEQVLRLLEKKGWDYKPDILIVYCGNNDASISGAYSDRELLAGQKLKSLRSLFSHLAMYRVMRAMLRPMNPSVTEIAPENLKVRVTPEQYGANLASIVEQGRRRHCPVIILKPPVPYLWPAGLQFKPFLHTTGADGEVILPEAMAAILGRDITYCLDENMSRQLYGEADIFTREVYQSAFHDSLPPSEEVERYTSMTASEPDNPVWYNDLGVARWRLNDYPGADSALQSALRLFRNQHPDLQCPAIMTASSPILYNLGINGLSQEPDHLQPILDTTGKAFAYLDSALQSDYFSLRIKRPYWDEIDRLGRSADLAIIDLPGIFRENGGEKLFIDHCHPTAEGHMLIARSLYETLIRRHWL